MKKNHACGGNTFTVMRAGMDFRLQCDTCKAQIWLSRPDVEKRLKKVLEPQEDAQPRSAYVGQDEAERAKREVWDKVFGGGSRG